jgi:hypothetical protein
MIYLGEDDCGACYQVVPVESEKSLEIDINNDGINDFIITHSHWYGTYMYSPHYWGDIYRNFKTDIQGFNTNQILTKWTNCWSFTENVTIGDTIDSKARYTAPPNPGWQWVSENVYIYMYSCTAMCYGYPETEYIGVSITKNDSIYYGWLRIYSDQNAFTLKEYTVNLTAGNFILVGQIEKLTIKRSFIES